jgi:galactokinase
VSSATAAETARATTDAFRAVHGTAPEGVWAAPGRVNLIGEHTDYNGGHVLPFALPHTTRAAVARRADGLLRLHSADVPGGVAELRLDELDPARAGADPATSWADYPAGVVWALREAGCAVGGADLHFESTVPTGAGLSSSAALEVAAAVALDELYGLGLRRWELAGLCRRAENAYVGAPTGIMDQAASACCETGHALHLDTLDLSMRQIPFDPAAAGLRVLVVDTRVKHAHSDGEYGRRRAGCEAAAAALGVTTLREITPADLDAALAELPDAEQRRLVRHVVTENARVEQAVALLEGGEIRALGPILTAGHASLRDDFRVSCAELDLVARVAEETGALGARMTGGGFGGSAIALVEADAVEAVGRAITDAFAAAGLTEPRLFEAVAAAGARRLA